MASACDSFQLQLSGFADGELSVKERSQVELHLSGCDDCRRRLDDIRAMSVLLNERLMAAAEEADFSRFADKVMARVTPKPPPLMERIKVLWQEILTYHRTAVVSSFATAAVVLAVGVPMGMKLAGREVPNMAAVPPEVLLRELHMSDPNLQPVVMKTEDGHTLIMLVNHAAEAAHDDNNPEAPALNTEPPKGGDL